MPAASFHEYARGIEEVLAAAVAAGEVVVVNTRIDQRSMLRGLISGVLQFGDASELCFREFVDISLPEPRLAYAYHYQDENGKLVFRYDNASHRPPLSQAEHRHSTAGALVCLAPTLAQVVDEVIRGTES